MPHYRGELCNGTLSIHTTLLRSVYCTCCAKGSKAKSTVTTPSHCVWRKFCGNEEGFTPYPTVPMHKVTEFGEIRTKCARNSYKFTKYE